MGPTPDHGLTLIGMWSLTLIGRYGLMRSSTTKTPAVWPSCWVIKAVGRARGRGRITVTGTVTVALTMTVTVTVTTTGTVAVTSTISPPWT